MQAEGLIEEIATEEEHDHNGTVVEHAHDSPNISRMFFSNNGGWAALLDEAVLMYRYARALLLRIICLGPCPSFMKLHGYF